MEEEKKKISVKEREKTDSDNGKIGVELIARMLIQRIRQWV